MINCRRIHDSVSFSAAETYSKCDLAYPCGPHLTNRLAIPSPSLFFSSFFLSLFLSLPLTRTHSYLSPFRCPTRYISFALSLPRQRGGTLIHLPSLSISVSSPRSSLFLSPLTLYGRPSTTPLPLRPPAFRGVSVAKSRLYLVSCKSEQFASLTNDSNLKHPL